MKYMELTQDQFAIIDDDMFDILSSLKWFAHFDRGRIYPRRQTSRSLGNRKTEFMHWYVIGKPIRGFCVDHINGNGLDARRENLRIVTRRQNRLNLLTHRQQGYPGGKKMVTKRNGKTYIYWQSQIEIDGIKRHLGTFRTKEEASKAYAGYFLTADLNDRKRIFDEAYKK